MVMEVAIIARQWCRVGMATMMSILLCDGDGSDGHGDGDCGDGD